MYLNIILTIFVVLQITTLVLVYKWWDKYGRTLFTSFTDIKKILPTKTPNSVGFNDVGYPNPFQNIPDMKDMMKQLESMSKNMGKFK